jgi:hypothetical protein
MKIKRKTLIYITLCFILLLGLFSCAANRHSLRTVSDFDKSSEFASLANLLKGKSVAIVGPAGSYSGSNLGAEIDSHDIVCRINYPQFKDPSYVRDYGARGDIMFNVLFDTAMGILERTKQQWKDYQLIIGTEDLPKRRLRFFSINDFNVPYYGVPYQWWVELNQHLSHPNTGITALAFLVQTEIKQLDIYGYDFYSSGYHPFLENEIEALYSEDGRHPELYKLRKAIDENYRRNNHKQNEQFAFFKKYILSDPRVNWIKPR